VQPRTCRTMVSRPEGRQLRGSAVSPGPPRHVTAYGRPPPMTAPSAWELAPRSATNRPSESFSSASSTLMTVLALHAVIPAVAHVPPRTGRHRRDVGPSCHLGKPSSVRATDSAPRADLCADRTGGGGAHGSSSGGRGPAAGACPSPGTEALTYGDFDAPLATAGQAPRHAAPGL
jgi:hypothetical protein